MKRDARTVLAAIERAGSVLALADAAGVDPQTVYRWLWYAEGRASGVRPSATRLRWLARYVAQA